MSRRARGLLAATLAVIMVMWAPLAARADGTHDYYTSVISTLSPYTWSSFSSPHPTPAQFNFVPSGSGQNAGKSCAGFGDANDGTTENPAVTGGLSWNAYGCDTGSGAALANVPGPFSGDAHDGALEWYGNQSATTPYIDTFHSNQGGGWTDTSWNTSQAVSFWFKPIAAGRNGSGNYYNVMASGYRHTANEQGSVPRDLYPAPAQYYVGSYDDFATLCYGIQGTPNGQPYNGAAGFSKTERCVPFGGSVGKWVLLTVYFKPDQSGATGCNATLGLSIDDKVVDPFTVCNREGGDENGPVFAGSTGGPGYAGAIWGVGLWESTAADSVYTPQHVSDMFYAPGTGQGPASGYQPQNGLPGGTVTGNGTTCTQGAVVAQLSGKCKFQVGHLGITDCGAQQAGHNWWDVGADVTTALCYVGNIIATGLNLVIDAINVILDLIVPSAQLADPIVALKDALLSHQPFSTMAAGVTGLSDALNASPQSFSLSLGSPTPLDINGHLSVLDPWRTPMAALIWLGAVVGVVRNARGDLSGGGDA